MDVGLQITLLLVALGLMSFYTGRRKVRGLVDQWRAFTAWQAAGMPAAAPAGPAAGQAQAVPWNAPADVTLMPGAGHALKSPPSDVRAIVDYIRTMRGGAPYSIPLGWLRDSAGRADLVTAQLVGDVNHILISGASDSGKDNAVMGMLLALATQHSAQALQFCIIDGKGLDWAGWASKAHAWRVALEPEEIGPAMLAISEERRRRGAILRAAGVAKWDEYQGGDLPLLVVFISELSLLEDATKASELTSWLNSELSAGRAFGLRFIIGTQNASNFSTRWRGQIGLYLAGFQPSRSADEPNTGLTSSDLAELGAIAPSQLPAPPAGAGVFTAVQGRNVATVRASLLPSQHRAWVLGQLPSRPATERNKMQQNVASVATQAAPLQQAQASRPAGPALPQRGDDRALLELLHTGQPLPIEPASGSTPVAAATRHQEAQDLAPVAAPTSGSGSGVLGVSGDLAALPVAPDLVPADEQWRILAAAQEATSRRQVGLKLYEATGGQKYRWVQAVCDAAGLLMPQGGA